LGSRTKSIVVESTPIEVVKPRHIKQNSQILYWPVERKKLGKRTFSESFTKLVLDDEKTNLSHGVTVGRKESPVETAAKKEIK